MPHSHVSPREMMSFVGKASMSSWHPSPRAEMTVCGWYLGLRGSGRNTLSFPCSEVWGRNSPRILFEVKCQSQLAGKEVVGLQRCSSDGTSGDEERKPPCLSRVPAQKGCGWGLSRKSYTLKSQSIRLMTSIRLRQIHSKKLFPASTSTGFVLALGPLHLT